MATTTKPSRPHLVTRFHALILFVILAITITAWARVPPGTSLPVHWGPHAEPDLLWSKEMVLPAAPLIGAALIIGGIALDRLIPARQLEGGRHVLEVMLSTLLALIAAIQFGLLMIGIGSDIDVIRIVSGAFAVILLILGNELRSAQPQPYAGLRLPWTLRKPWAWNAAHQLTGALVMLGSIALGAATWLWPDPATLIAAMAGAIAVPLLIGGLVSLMLASR